MAGKLDQESSMANQGDEGAGIERELILERRGWRFHRIWSRTWWENHFRELERFEDAVRQALGG